MILTYHRRRRRQPMDDDMISMLPDVLIERIISLLSLEEAVRTSILSKRWEFLWTSFPNLVFDYVRDEDMKFVDRALLLRGSTRVHKFSIDLVQYMFRFEDSYTAIHLIGWINDIVRLHVEDLHLDLSGRCFGKSLEFPQCLFTCASLTSFSLHTHSEFIFPPSTNLSNLKNLLLEYVYFPDAKSVDNLFHGCPMLETVSLLECEFMCDSRISAPKLYELVVVEPRESENWPICDVMIFAPSLKYFHLQWDYTNSYCLYDQPAIDEAAISISLVQSSFQDKNDWEVFICRFYKLLKVMNLVKKLSLSSQSVEALGYQGNLPAQVPVFSNLSTLSFNGSGKIGFDLKDSDGNSRLSDQYIGLMKILQNSPCLEFLRFETGIILSADYEEYERTLNLVPPCYLSSLRTFEIVFFNNNDYRKLFTITAKKLLERASVLEKFIIYASKFSRVSPTKKEKLIKDLKELPRTSKDCQFEFSDLEMKPI